MLDTNLLKFLIRQRLVGFDVPNTPHFDAESTPYFLERLAESKRYLEYGAGGSTIQAARLGTPFCTVESDPYFLKSVKRKIGSNINGTLLHADIGMTGYWGCPIITTPTPSRVKRWQSYADLPWMEFGATLKPDLILIDGRFRILCALTSVLHLDGHPCEILFDDYLDRRSHYRVVEQFAELTGFVGRMAIFKPKINSPEIKREIHKHASDFS